MHFYYHLVFACAIFFPYYWPRLPSTVGFVILLLVSLLLGLLLLVYFVRQYFFLKRHHHLAESLPSTSKTWIFLVLILLMLVGTTYGSWRAHLYYHHLSRVHTLVESTWVEGYVSGLPHWHEGSKKLQFNLRVASCSGRQTRADQQGNTAKNTLEHALLKLTWFPVTRPYTSMSRYSERLSLFEQNSPTATTQLAKGLADEQEDDNDKEQLAKRIQPYDCIRLKTKLKAPRGLANISAFDYEKWLVGHGISATGYVKELQVAEKMSKGGIAAYIHRIRQQIRQRLQQAEGIQFSGLHQALLIGSNQAVPAQYMTLFQQSGLIHLLVVSGMHIGYAAALGWCLGFGMVCLLQPLLLYCRLSILAIRAPQVACWSAMLCAIGYAALAGFSVVSLRAALMIIFLLLPRALGWQASIWTVFGYSILLNAIYQPSSILLSGFWLSYGAVFILLCIYWRCYTPSIDAKKLANSELTRHVSDHKNTGKYLGCQALLSYSSLVLKRLACHAAALIKLQLFLFIALTPLTLLLIGQVSRLTLVNNLVAVPLISLWIVPLDLLGMLLSAIPLETVNSAAHICWLVADQGMALLMGYLQWSSTLVSEPMVFAENRTSLSPAMHVLILLSCCMAVLLFCAIPSLCIRLLLAGSIVIFVMVPIRDTADVSVTVMDVGQGSALLIQSRNETLLYDTGKKFSDSFDSGQHIVLPYLRRQGIQQLTHVVISHGDADHIGGFAAIRDNIHIDNLWVAGLKNTQATQPEFMSAKRCHHDTAFQIGHIDVRGIWPLADEYLAVNSLTTNNQSCVLLLTFDDTTILLTGDIERLAELSLLAILDGMELSRNRLLLVAHHGSRSSSSAAFLQQYQPTIAMISSGYDNAYGHPHRSVVSSLNALETALYRTDLHGAIHVSWARNTHERNISWGRQGYWQWWRHPSQDHL